MASSVSRTSRRTLAAVLVLSSLPALAQPALKDSAEAREAAQAICGYVEARNRNDVPEASSFSADDVRWLDTEGKNHPKNVERLKTMIPWEHAMGGKWSCRVLDFADGWLEVEISEQNRMYDALGIGAIFQRTRVRVEAGKIREGRTMAEWSTGRDEDEAFGGLQEVASDAARGERGSCRTAA